MNKIKYLLMLLLFIPSIVLAMPNATLSTSSKTIESGKKVTATVTLTDTAAWNIRIIGSGKTSCSSKFADVTDDGKSTTKSFKLDCTSTGVGEIKFTVTGDITSGSGETKDISLTEKVTVKEIASSINTLSDLKVDGVTISGFSSSKTSYTLKDNSSNNINISAKATDSKARVTGVGKKNLSYGKNTFKIVVTAENGSKKTYTIIVNKPDTRSTNNYLKSLNVDKGKISFDKNITSYTIKVEHNIEEINITAESEDSNAKIEGTGKKVLENNSNEFNIIVTAENGSSKTYTLNIIKKDEVGNNEKLSSDNSVKKITIHNYEIDFNKDIKTYSITVEKDINSIDINVIPNDSKASVNISGNSNFKAGINTVSIKITSEDGQVNEYIINVYKEVDDNTQNIEIEKEDNNTWLIISIVAVILIGIIIFIIVNKKKKNNN